MGIFSLNVARQKEISRQIDREMSNPETILCLCIIFVPEIYMFTYHFKTFAVLTPGYLRLNRSEWQLLAEAYELCFSSMFY